MSLSRAMARRRLAGFTLIELMVAVAVVAVLAVIAYPSYVQYVRRGKIVEALGELAATRVKLEQYYQDHRDYGSTATACGVSLPSEPSFSFSCNWGSGGTSQSYLMTATGLASGGMSGYVYTIDHNNTQQTVQFAGDTVNASCWLKKQGESC